MTELLTAAQMRAIEQAAIKGGGVTGLELMERAGRGVIEAIFEEWPDLAQAPHRAVVLCGPGNNGGDGFVVARLLKEWGWELDVFLYGDPDQLPPDAKTNCHRWQDLGEVTVLGFPVLSSEDSGGVADAAYGQPGTRLIVDAFFGTGLARPISGLQPFLKTHDQHASADDPVPIRTVAIDLPSGLCSDSGKPICGPKEADTLWTAVQADLTVSFHRFKYGHVLMDGPRWCGKVVAKGIGLESNTGTRAEDGTVGGHSPVPADEIVQLVEPPDLQALSKQTVGHKYSNGHALVLSGPAGSGGAARLAARGALRIGAGLVSVVCDDVSLAEHAAHLTAVMTKPIKGAAGLSALLDDPRFTALCLGPGLGLDRARALVPAALAAKRATVLDADALMAFADAPDALFDRLHGGCVLTPHGGEFRRLFPDIAEKLAATPTKGPAYSKVDATREAAARAGCTVLFKGPDTVIAAPSGRASVHAAVYDRAAPWLATAGSGDVLAGFITGLLARGFAPMRACETAAWLHVEAARRFGPGLIAEDLPEELPGVFRALGL